MPNRQLSKTEIQDLFQPLYQLVTSRLQESSRGDSELLWALRRKLAKSLVYDERGTPMLTYTRHPEHGPVWVLSYLDERGGVDDHVIPGDITDVDSVVESARAWLRRARS